MIRAVLFDMNSIIIYNERIHEMAFKETVKPFSVDTVQVIRNLPY